MPPRAPADPMSAWLHDACVPVFARYLERLQHLVERARAEVESGRIAEAELLHDRLAPDMLPWRLQVHVAANFALRAAWPMTGRPRPDDGEAPATLHGLLQRVQSVRGRLATLGPADFDGADRRIVHDRLGPGRGRPARFGVPAAGRPAQLHVPPVDGARPAAAARRGRRQGRLRRLARLPAADLTLEPR